MSEAGLFPTTYTEGRETDSDLVERSLSFWESLFSSGHPMICRPAIDAELTVPMGRPVRDKQQIDELQQQTTQKQQQHVVSSATATANLLRVRGGENRCPSGGLLLAQLPKSVITTGNGPKSEMTLLVVSHPAPIRHLLQALSTLETNDHEPLQWTKSQLHLAQKEKFWVPRGSITEITMVGSLRPNHLDGVAQAYGGGESARSSWNWQGIVER